jgi:uncharacterized damage-inducible protein DinB
MEEPWLRGPIPGVDPMVAPVLMSFQMAREDLARFTEGLSFAQLWKEWPGIASVGFHLQHIQGSVDRLCHYLEGRPLNERYFVFLAQEAESGPTREELLAGMDEAFRRCEQVVRGLGPAELLEPRFVGRKKLPTTVIGLVVHIAEHTQRHTGQAIVTAKFARLDTLPT